MSHVFISYSKKNRDYVRRLADHLLELGFDVWIDDRIDYGNDWWCTIVRAIRDAKAFIVIMTDESDQSVWVQREVTLADKHKIPAFPIWLAGDFHSSENWAIYVRTQYADVRKGQLPPIDFYERLAEVAPRRSTHGEVVTETPKEAVRSESRRKRWLVGAAGVGVVALISVLSVLSNPNQTLSTMTPPTEVAQASTSTPVPLGFPGNPVTRNTGWTPTIQDFDDVQMALVPVGCFMMGSEDGDEDERPVHQQCFDEPFWIDVTEVTNAQYGSDGYFSGANRPREQVTWYEARDFCANPGGRLPTEAEWEYAARGPDGLTYPLGNEFVAENVVYFDNSGGQTAEVGSRPGGISWVGALDMSGNVWEWTSTIYRDYPYDASDDRESNSDTNSARVLRGGSWGDIGNLVRAATRLWGEPTVEYFNIGFRCARDFVPSDLEGVG
jgi:formylglycine-generating enzyme